MANRLRRRRGIAELREPRADSPRHVPNLVSLTSPQTDQQIAELYDGSPATLMGVHPDRNITGQGGIWRPVRQCWDYRDSRVPWVIDEPIGHKSTVAEDFDPLRQAMAAANGWLTGAAGYVVHAGAGIRGGGAEDLQKGREANWFDVPGAAAVFAAINALRDLLPRDLPNFDHHNAGWATYPFESSLLTQPAGFFARGSQRIPSCVRGDGVRWPARLPADAGQGAAPAPGAAADASGHPRTAHGRIARAVRPPRGGDVHVVAARRRSPDRQIELGVDPL